MNLLCGDIGGTKTLLQLAEYLDGQFRIIDQQRFSSSDYDEFDKLLTFFLEGHSDIQIDSACFGVAGPVQHHGRDQCANVTNLPWHLDSNNLQAFFGIGRVTLINDFEAIGYGLATLTASDLITLQTGEATPRGNQLVIGAGTGLGVAQLLWSGDHYRVSPTEGGHSDFGPANRRQLDLAAHIIARQGRCSKEDVVSGPGLVNIHEHIVTNGGGSPIAELQLSMSTGDRAAAIAEFALSDRDITARKALELFIECYGSEAGNFALATLARGGVYVAGGIAPKIINELLKGEFIAAFRNKGKMASLVARIPVWVVMNPEVGLLGSREIARRHSSGL